MDTSTVGPEQCTPEQEQPDTAREAPRVAKGGGTTHGAGTMREMASARRALARVADSDLLGVALRRDVQRRANVAVLQRCVDDVACACDVSALPSEIALPPAGALLARQVAAVPPMAPGPGGTNCWQILGEILSFLFGGPQHTVGGTVVNGPNIHRGLIERYEHLRADPRGLFGNHRSVAQAHPQYGSWEGHQAQFRQQAAGLRERLNRWVRNGCDDPGAGLPEVARSYVRRAWDYATREPPVQPAPQQQHAQAQSVDYGKILEVLTILGLSVALVGLVAIALLDPEPVSKLGAIGLTAATASTLLVMLGLSDAEPSQQPAGSMI